MKPKIILCLFILQMIILPQTNFIEQITIGDFDARNPFIYKNSFGEYRELFFELHKNGYSNIYSIKYNSDTKKFEDTVALTSGNYLNINPVFKPNLGLLYQTNKNGNWDIMLLPDSSGVWKSPRFLTNSLSDEISPKFFETMSSWEDSARILFERDDKLVYLSFKENIVNEEIVFQNKSDITYYNFTGLQTGYGGATAGFYVYAIEDSSNHKKIVSRYKPFNGTWKNTTILKDNCDCDDLSVQIAGYAFWGLFYSDTVSAQRRLFVIQDDPSISNPQSELVEIRPDGNLSSFDLFALLLVGKRNFINHVTDYYLYFPYTFIVEQAGKIRVRTDISSLGFWDRDSLIETSVLKPNLAIGPLGAEYYRGIVVFTIWEDSSNGRIHLFGTKQYLQYGSVENESFAKDFVLYQNYPNPFNPNTTIEYKILKGSEIRFNVINILGEKVFEKNFGYQSPGNYKIDFSATGGSANGGNAHNLPSGVYIYSIITDENKLSRKMLLLK